MNVDVDTKLTFDGSPLSTLAVSADAKRDKLEFAAREMFVALQLATNATDDFTARALARHVLVRVRDFISLAYDLLGVLGRAGLNIEGERERMRAYASVFEEYFDTTRTKLAAHVQDLEFAERLELWTDIDIGKLSYFAEGAYEILNGVTAVLRCAPLQVPAMPELRPPVPLAPIVQMGADVLASTRPNTIALLNMTGVHQRAGELATISRWLRAEWALALKGPPLVEMRVLKARIITDAVSFADCLRTRPDGDPSHRGAGLDDLLRGCQGDPSPIDEFRKTYHFERDISALRTVRNHIGAHLERDDAVDLITLLAELDAVSLEWLAFLLTRMASIYRAVCRRTLFLTPYLADGEQFVGAIPTREPIKTFDGSTRVPEMAPHGPPSSPHEALGRWTATNGSDVAIRHWFFNALQPRRVELVDGVSAPQLTEAHEVVLAALLGARSAPEAECVLRLIEACARGYPNELAEILRRVYVATDACKEGSVRLRSLVRALGALPLNNGEWARKPIRDALQNAEPLTAAQAHQALFFHLAVDVQAKRTATIFVDHLAPSIAQLMPLTQLVVLASLASMLVGEPLGTRLTQSELTEEYDSIKAAISETMPLLGAQSADEPWAKVLASGDFVGFAALGAERLAATDAEAAQLLRVACCEGLIKASAHPEVVMVSMANLATVQLHVDHQAATQIARHVIVTYPLAVDLQIAMLGVLLSAGVPAKQVRSDLEAFVTACNLPPELKPRIIALHNECDARLDAMTKGAPHEMITPPEDADGID
jgi:hypothetical protein